VSEDTGWRKPHKRIFQTALRKLQVKAMETIFVGDSPLEDIEGAKTAGMKTIFVISQFNKLEDLSGIKQQPDIIAEDLQEIHENLDRLITAKRKQAANP
jgi:putative hydrolase of the HAD superfamily